MSDTDYRKDLFEIVISGSLITVAKLTQEELKADNRDREKRLECLRRIQTAIIVIRDYVNNGCGSGSEQYLINNIDAVLSKNKNKQHF